MPFNNSITKFNKNTLNSFDVFNDVNFRLLENTLYNKKLLESLYNMYEKQDEKICFLEKKIEELNTMLQSKQ